MNVKKVFSLRNGILLLLAIVIAGAFVSCSKSKGDKQRYRTEDVSTGRIEQTVSANGTLNPVTLVSVGTQVSGTVQKLYTDFNARVEQGQVLMELDDSLLRAAVQQSEANIASAQSALSLAQSNMQRLQPLAKDGFASQQELDQAKQALKEAQARVAQTTAQLAKDRANLGYTVIRSPVSGVVVSRAVDVGQTVAASFQTPELFKIAKDLREMQIDAYFSEADVGRIRVGQSVKFRVDAFPNESFKGLVKQVRLNPKTDSNVVTYDVVVAVDNPEEKLLPGMTAYVDVRLAEKEDVLRLPNAALRFHPEDGDEDKKDSGDNAGGGKGKGKGKRQADEHVATVYVLDGEALKKVTVQTGIADRRYTEVVSGLKANSAVVVEDLSLVGQKRKTKGFQMGM